MQNSRHDIFDHFAKVSKMVEADVSSNPVIDYKLTRYDCCFIVENGDPRKKDAFRFLVVATMFVLMARVTGISKGSFKPFEGHRLNISRTSA